MKDFRELKVWQKAHLLTLAIYRITNGFPKNELFGITSQVRRACASVPANIAEGCCRSSDADFARFLHIAMGSASEVDYHLLLARDLSLLKEADYGPLALSVSEIKRMLTALIQRLSKSA